jgi:hypothetical protein
VLNFAQDGLVPVLGSVFLSSRRGHGCWASVLVILGFGDSIGEAPKLLGLDAGLDACELLGIADQRRLGQATRVDDGVTPKRTAVSQWHGVLSGGPADLEHALEIAAEPAATSRAVGQLSVLEASEGDERITAAVLGPDRPPPARVESITDPDRLRGQQSLLLEPARGQIVGRSHPRLALARLEHERRLTEVGIGEPGLREPFAARPGETKQAMPEHDPREPIGEHEQHVAELAPRIDRDLADLHAIAAEPGVSPLPHADQLDLDAALPVGLGPGVMNVEPKVPLQRVAVASTTPRVDQVLGRRPERNPAGSLGEQLEMSTATRRRVALRRRMTQR